MSDTPQGGWWKARDGKWYPPETHPDYRPLADAEVAAPPAQGWWRANDGNWYPPETAPGATADGGAGGGGVDTDAAASELPTPEPGGTAGAEPEIDLTVPTSPATRTPGSLFGTPAPGPAEGASGPAEGIAGPPASEPSPAAPPTVDAPSGPPAAPSTPAPGAAALPAMPSAPVSTGHVDAAAGAAGTESPVSAGSGPATAAPPRPSIPQDRRGLFDLEPPDENEAPVDPPARSRPLFGGSAAQGAPAPAAEGPATSSSRGPLPSPGSPSGPGSTTGPMAAAAGGAVLGAAAGAAAAAPGAAPTAPGAAPTAPVDPDATMTSPGITAPSGPMPTGMPVTGGAPTGEPAEDGDGGDGSGSRRWLLIGGAVVLVLLLGALAFLVLGGGEDDTAAPASTAAPTSTTTTTTEATTTTTTVVPEVIPSQVTGVGTATVDVGSDVTDRFLALVTHDGPGQVLLELVAADGVTTQALVGPGVSGQYLGVLPVNFAEGQSFRSVRYTGEGPWAVTFVLTGSAPEWDPAEGPLSSTGDRVVNVSVDEATPVRVECDGCVGAPVVRAWAAGPGPAPEPLVAADGVVTVPAGTVALQLTATGPDGVSPAWTATAE